MRGIQDPESLRGVGARMRFGPLARCRYSIKAESQGCLPASTSVFTGEKSELAVTLSCQKGHPIVRGSPHFHAHPHAD